MDIDFIEKKIKRYTGWFGIEAKRYFYVINYYSILYTARIERQRN